MIISVGIIADMRMRRYLPMAVCGSLFYEQHIVNVLKTMLLNMALTIRLANEISYMPNDTYFFALNVLARYPGRLEVEVPSSLLFITILLSGQYKNTAGWSSYIISCIS